MWHNKLCFSLLFSIAAAVGQAAPFPLCIYGVDNPADLKTVKKAGFSCIQTYKTDPETLSALAAEAQKQGLQVVFYPNKIIGSSYEKQAQNWPVLAWYLVDEPDVARWPRARVLETYNKTKAAFPAHDTALVIGQGKTDTPFYDLPDILMVDWYPVPHLPLTSFGDQLALARRGMVDMHAGKNPLWGVVQAFDWKEYKQYRSDENRIGRFPTEEEMRFMSYHAIVNGADGLFYFIFTTQGKPLPQARPDWWKRLAAVTKELNKFKPVLENGTEAPNPAEFSPMLFGRSWQYQNKHYTVLINASETPQPLPPALLEKKYKTMFGRKKAAQMPPYQVWVFKY